MKHKILSIGEIIWDVFPDKQVIGGAPLNFAAHCALCGAESAILSAVGEDALGDAALDSLAEFCVSEKYVKKLPYPTGQCLVSLDERAIPSYNVLRNVAYDKIAVEEADLACIRTDKYDALYFGTLVQRDSVSREAVRRVVTQCSFGEILCDVNLRPNCYDSDSVEFCLKHATVLKVSIEEEPILRSCVGYVPTNDSAEEIARAICKDYKNIKIVLVTLGKDGSYVYHAQSGDGYSQCAIGECVVSTVGAGDSFAAAWLTGFLDGRPMEECMKKAATISGFVVAHTEAVPKYEIRDGLIRE